MRVPGGGVLMNTLKILRKPAELRTGMGGTGPSGHCRLPASDSADGRLASFSRDLFASLW